MYFVLIVISYKELRYREELQRVPHSFGILHIGTSSQAAGRNPRFTRDPIFAMAQTLRLVL